MSSDSGSGSMNSGGRSAHDAVLLTMKGLDLFRKGDFNNSLTTLNASLVLDPLYPDDLNGKRGRSRVTWAF